MSVVHATGREVPKNNAPESLQWSDILRCPLYIPIHPIQASPINRNYKSLSLSKSRLQSDVDLFSKCPAFKADTDSDTDSNSKIIWSKFILDERVLRHRTRNVYSIKKHFHMKSAGSPPMNKDRCADAI
jgi:hypothetical protein